MLRLITAFAALLVIALETQPARADIALDIQEQGVYVSVGNLLYYRQDYAVYVPVTVIAIQSPEYAIQFGDGSTLWVYGDTLYTKEQSDVALAAEVAGPAVVIGGTLCLVFGCGSDNQGTSSSDSYSNSNDDGYDPMEHQQACDHGACGPSQ